MSAERSERVGDMDNFSRLIVFRQEDGDIIVQVVEEDKPYLKIAAVEFCTPAGGGGRSRATFDALLELIEAMERDNEEQPQNFLKSPKSP